MYAYFPLLRLFFVFVRNHVFAIASSGQSLQAVLDHQPYSYPEYYAQFKSLFKAWFMIETKAAIQVQSFDF